MNNILNFLKKLPGLLMEELKGFAYMVVGIIYGFFLVLGYGMIVTILGDVFERDFLFIIFALTCTIILILIAYGLRYFLKRVINKWGGR